ncbi:MAG: 2-C-methyl-D-erythritol 4-phosphate cytidylyltransferase [Dehalococcoidia bacterium]|uniref:2-C-methyl-D-erythritol 4-phosphate cytidylyltransferase n=1 Tax=Candidatus Amarobacter glycogenicus TaxID=3140699 RepID=UPI003135A9A5|nr:2-C-methyl-D-erythritol 4-phosphate cytidylyltransferase [Dehalococcoidia bacterium]MBK7328930.1 2-C-methyl-D-erythritol 4-phosphate cytidylyltransferase [Dehalococcoidia bacterium]
MEFDAVVVAAGSSTRFGGRDKLFADLAGRPVLAWSLAAFEATPGLHCLVVVSAPDRVAEMTELAEAWCPRACFRVVEGGARRRDSVEAGLRQCSTRYVAIHDGARPLLTPELLGRVLTAAEGKPGAIAATRVTDTIKEVSGNRIVAHPDRARLWAAQTPQVVLRQAWLDAAAMGDNDETDDAAMLSRLGLECEVVEAGAENLKITRPLDLDVAAALLQRRGEP